MLGTEKLPTSHPQSSMDSGGQLCLSSSSPEFEFWMVRNPSIPSPNLVPADELFVDGILLPLHLLRQTPAADSAAPLSASKRWTNLFKKATPEKTQQKFEKKKGRKSCQSGAELNINIWPFSRSRSAGNRPSRMFPSTRKVNSAPCSRSNSKSRSPGRPAGVHLGRSSPVWQVRRVKNGDPRMKTGGGRTSEVVNSEGATCSHLSCRSNENGGSGAALFNLRSFFNKKVY